MILSRSNHLNCNFVQRKSCYLLFFSAQWHFGHPVMLFKWLEFMVKLHIMTTIYTGKYVKTVFYFGARKVVKLLKGHFFSSAAEIKV